MGGYRGNDRLVTVTASCGHEVHATQYGMRGGEKSRANAARAREGKCYDCLPKLPCGELAMNNRGDILTCRKGYGCNNK